MKPVIVQHYSNPLGEGGPATQLKQLLESPLANKYEFVPCLQPGPAGGINLRLIREMSKSMRAARPAMVHVRGMQNEGFHGVLAARAAGCSRILVSAHGFIGDLVYPPSRVKQKLVSSVLEPLTLRMASGVYCVCHAGANRPVVRRHARRNFGVVHNAAQQAATLPPSSVLGVRQKFGIHPEDVMVVAVSRISREKGLFTLCDAAMNLRERFHSLKFVVVGEGPHRAELQARATKQAPGQFAFAGKQLDVAPLLQAADVFVHPSLHENCPVSVLEAMSCGRPVIASAVGGIPELIEHEESGLLVPPGSAGALADGLARLATDGGLRWKLGEAARRRALDWFSSEQQLEKLDKIYEQVLTQ